MKPLSTGKRSLGLAVPLLSLRTEAGPCGEFSDLRLLSGLAKSWGMDIVQLLPLNDSGSQTSPYGALSAFALNPIYLRLSELPEAKALPVGHSLSEAIQALIRDFSGEAKVSYGPILERKLEILEGLWNLARGRDKGPLMQELETWAGTREWVKPYACFVELKRRNRGLPWWKWAELREPTDADIGRLWDDPAFASGLRFWTWIQMRAADQLSEASRKARDLGVDVMGDIPILMNEDSADVWHRRAFFDLGLSAGAPPDMYARLGQNWGFPLYRWEAIEKADYSFWKRRLETADAYYSLYRIDHVLGFFRIWAIGKRELDGFLGRFEPEYAISYPELDALGFDRFRIRWLSKPHVPGAALAEALSPLSAAAAALVRDRLFERIGDEDLFLFAPWVRGGVDIAEAVGKAASEAEAESDGRIEAAVQAAIAALLGWWRNRTLLEIGPGRFVAGWEYQSTQAWASLSDHERTGLSALVARRRAESLALWEKTGRRLLSVLSDCVAMRPCAEDLGAVPPCVPQVLGELEIPGLRVLRWHRAWGASGSPYVPFSEYPEASVACSSVHDSTSLRQWWEEEAERGAVWRLAGEALRARTPRRPEGRQASTALHAPELAGEPPESLDPESAFALLAALATAASRIVVFPLQDLLAAHAAYREEDPAEERINVPGTSDGRNWLYKVKPRLETLLGDGDFSALLSSLGRFRR